MKQKKMIYYLIIGNLTLIFLYLLRTFPIVKEVKDVLVLVILTPIAFGVFIFYILRPLNRLFLKKGMKKSKAATLTLIIVMFILAGIIKYFGEYFLEQVLELKLMALNMFNEEYMMGEAENYINIKGIISSISSELIGYVSLLISNVKLLFDKGMMLFSNVLLVILIAFFLLRDGDKFKAKVLNYFPEKYKDIVGKILSQGDAVLSTYIIGQAIVALSLASMVFVGYLIIKMPSALLLASVTFILAFIPFVGFFISMIIPYIIAIVMGFNMVLKLSLLFVIAQTLKGRVVVPFIMGRAMKIHPITDIFLVVGAAAIGGPLAAFSIVPIYSLLKIVVRNLRDEGIIKGFFNVDKRNKV